MPKPKLTATIELSFEQLESLDAIIDSFTDANSGSDIGVDGLLTEAKELQGLFNAQASIIEQRLLKRQYYDELRFQAWYMGAKIESTAHPDFVDHHDSLMGDYAYRWMGSDHAAMWSNDLKTWTTIIVNEERTGTQYDVARWIWDVWSNENTRESDKPSGIPACVGEILAGVKHALQPAEELGFPREHYEKLIQAVIRECVERLGAFKVRG